MQEPVDPGDDGHTTPTWVKALVGMLVLAAIAAVVVMALTGGDHGPGRHLPGNDDVPVEHTSPPGGHD